MQYDETFVPQTIVPKVPFRLASNMNFGHARKKATFDTSSEIK